MAKKKSVTREQQDMIVSVAIAEAESFLEKRQAELLAEIDRLREEENAVGEACLAAALKSDKVDKIKKEVQTVLDAIFAFQQSAKKLGLSIACKNNSEIDLSTGIKFDVRSSFSYDGSGKRYVALYVTPNAESPYDLTRLWVAWELNRDDPSVKEFLESLDDISSRRKERYRELTEVNRQLNNFSKFERRVRGSVARQQLEADPETKKLLEAALGKVGDPPAVLRLMKS